MNYSKSKAEKLVTEFDYLKSKPYFPYGKEGKEFKITELKAVPKLGAESFAEPPIPENEIIWYVLVLITHNNETISKDLKDVLKTLKIDNDIY
ncbi:hypothetical protein BWZ22_13430 [Seonamhaeicola sp. S2-3]|uniref:hypothetical protein n=1 Tax=Seonamhaeicola sp. S2-3 TaxID=1936081 RepID=UPI000972940B|nr:hypothetical protein [Seonamhaeicola sp. S2-3]APY12163.1 hypothetical protein BWZ22_13430 [Seonamhaeicola sp. S2-3]